MSDLIGYLTELQNQLTKEKESLEKWMEIYNSMSDEEMKKLVLGIGNCIECGVEVETDLLTSGKCPDCEFVINPQFAYRYFENGWRYICNSCDVELLSPTQFDNPDNHRDYCEYGKFICQTR